MNLPSFSGHETGCPKCGHFVVGVAYCSGSGWIGLSHLCRDRYGLPEHLHRRCGVCNYEWLEACLDTRARA